MWTLARKLLLHDRLRFVVAIAGVSVSVMLVLVQVGLYFGFMDTASAVIDASKADIWVGKRSNDSFEFATPFDERTYYKVASVDGVQQADRVLLNFEGLGQGLTTDALLMELIERTRSQELVRA